MSSQQVVKRGWMAVLIVTAILLIDQVIKIWVKTNMTLHEQIEIFSWFKIVFIENIFHVVRLDNIRWYCWLTSGNHHHK